MATAYFALGLSAFAGLAYAIARVAGILSPRRVVRYVPVGLISRRYVVWRPIPRRRKDPVPVVLGFHGGGGTLEQWEQHPALHTARTAADFVIVYPEGYHRTWNAGLCCGDALQANIDEVKFVRALLKDLASIIKIDRRRIYATGFSNGAMLCYYLACAMSEEIAAIAPVGGGMSVSACTPTRPVPIFHLHGLADEWAPYDSGQSIASPQMPPVADGIAFWRAVNDAGDEARERMFGGHAECTTYSGGPSDAQIRVCLIPGLGHHWPGGDQTPRTGVDARRFGPRGPAIDRNTVNDAILTFLAGYSVPESRLRRVSIGPGAASPPRSVSLTSR